MRQRPQAAALLDVVITSAAVAAAASALRALGATVSTAACAIDRSPAGSHLLSSERLAIRTVFTKDLLDAGSSRLSSWAEPGHSGLRLSARAGIYRLAAEALPRPKSGSRTY